MIPPGYTVTREGRVKGPSGRWLTPQNVNGQLGVLCQVERVQRRFYVGRLVCEVFHGPPPTPEHVAEHIDTDPLNNHADNLRWSLPSSVASRTHTDKEKPTIQGENHHAAVLTWELVRIIRREFAQPNPPSKIHLARQYGVTETTIHNVIINKTWNDPGYTPPVPRRPRKRTDP